MRHSDFVQGTWAKFETHMTTFLTVTVFAIRHSDFVQGTWAKTETRTKILLGRIGNTEEEEARQHLPIENDQDMRLVFGKFGVSSATLALVKRNVKYSDNLVSDIANFLFSGTYQEKRCLANRSGGTNSDVRKMFLAKNSITQPHLIRCVFLFHTGQADAHVSQTIPAQTLPGGGCGKGRNLGL